MSDSDNIYPPRLNTATRAVTQRIAVSSANATNNLATNLAKTGWLRLKAVGADIDLAIDVAGGTLVKDATGSGTTVGWTLASGQAEDYFNAGGLVVTTIASAAGFLVITRAGKDRVQSP